MLNWLRNSFRQELLSRAALDVEILQGLVRTAAGLRLLSALHWSCISRRRISNEITENEWHTLLLFHRRPLVVGLNCLVGLVSLYGLDVPRLRQWFVRCGSMPARIDISFITLLLTLTISWSLKQSIWRWIEMAQVVLKLFYWKSLRIREGKYLRIRFIFSISKAALVIFCRRLGTRLTSVQFVVFKPLWSFSQGKHCRCRWFFTSPSSKKEAKVEPNRKL